MVNLHVDQLLLELPPGVGLSRAASQQLVHEALALLAQRLEGATSSYTSRECRIDRLDLEGLALESLQPPLGPEMLCEALYARLMEVLR